MKTKMIITAVLMLFVATSGFSQKDSSGIYFTSDDFENHELSYAINCKTQKHKISKDMIFRDKIVSVNHNDTVYTFPKDSVYAIRNCDNSTIRFFKNKQYPLINSEEKIMIYKVVSRPSGKGQSAKTVYYFSNGPKDTIRELTLHNLKTAFPDNHKFHNLLDMHFNNDEDLTEYDNFHKYYKINHILKTSLEQ